VCLVESQDLDPAHHPLDKQPILVEKDTSGMKEILYVLESSARGTKTGYITFARPTCTFAQLVSEILWNHPNLPKFILKVGTQSTKLRTYPSSTHNKTSVIQLLPQEYFVLDMK